MSCKRKCAGLGMCAATCTPRAHARQSEAETESRSCCKKLASSLARRASTHLLVLRAAELNDALGCGVAHVDLAQDGVAWGSRQTAGKRRLIHVPCQQQQRCRHAAAMLPPCCDVPPLHQARLHLLLPHPAAPSTPPAPTSTMPAKTITLAECQEHMSDKDCWLVIEGKVYDVTPFLDEHPGGFDTLVSNSGGC